MISNEMLREAAGRTYEKYIFDLLSDFDPEYHCDFSLGFEKRINKLKRRANHPILYQAMKRIAIILLTILFAGTVWIAIDIEARATFFGWISELTGSYYEYHHKGTTNDNGEPAVYRPSWIPEGYSEESVKFFNDKTTIRYKNSDGELLRFSYVNTQREYDSFFDVTKGHTEQCLVGEYVATLFVSETNEVASAITWVDSNDTAFHLAGFISEAELIKIAESVEVLK